jgi:hypothetical protein
MKKKIFSLVIVTLTTCPLSEPLKASTTVGFCELETQTTDTRPSLRIRNGSTEMLLVEFISKDHLEGAAPFKWKIAPKAEDKAHHTIEITHDTFPSDQDSPLTKTDRYGTLKVFLSSALEKSHSTTEESIPIFEALIDTSGTFSYHAQYGPHYYLDPLDNTIEGTTAPLWIVKHVQAKLTTQSPLERVTKELREKWASMTSEEKEHPHSVDFPSCLHSIDWSLIPLPSKYLLRPAQMEDLRSKLVDFLSPPTESEIRAAEKELIAEGIKIFVHE